MSQLAVNEAFEMPESSRVDPDDLGLSYAKHTQNDEVSAAVAWMRGGGAASPETLGVAPDIAPEQAALPSDPVTSQGASPGHGEEAQGIFSTVARNVTDIPASSGYGAVEGLNEAVQLVYSMGEKLREWGPEFLDYSLNFDFRDGEGGYNLLPTVSWDKGKPAGVPQSPQFFNAPNTTTGKITSQISQFLTGFAVGGQALRGVKAAGTAARIGKGALQGAVSDFAFFDAQEERLSNLLQEVPALANPVSEYLAASDDDGEFEGRFKNAVEGLGLGAVTEGLFTAVRAIRAARKAKASGIMEEAAEESGGLAKAGMEETPPTTLETLGSQDAPLVRVDEAPVGQGAAMGGGRSVETEALERAGYAVDREVLEKPVAADNRRRYGIRREALEAEGELGERWTNIETKAEDWPTLPEKRGRKGEWVKEWRTFGSSLYNRLLGQRHQVVSSGDTIVLGAGGRRHMLGQGMTPEAVKAIPHLPEIIQKAFKTGEYNPKAGSRDMRAATVYHSAARIDGKLFDVQLVAKRNAAGEQELMLYDMRPRAKATDGPIEPQGLGSEAPGKLPQIGSPSVTDTLGTDGLKVNEGVVADPTTTRVADFFSDVKDIVDDLNPADVGKAAPDTPEKLYINFSRIDSPDDVKNALQQSADFYRGAVDTARRGTRSFEDIKLSAEQEDAWKILADRRTGEPLNAEQSLAARNLWASSGEKLSETARIAAESPSEENLFAFRKMLEVHRAVQNEVVAARTETARALASWRIPSGPSELMRRHLDDVLEGTGGKDGARELAARVAKLSESGMVQELEAFVAKSPARVTRESLQEAWVMSLLSGPKTHLVNMISNTTVAFQQVFEREAAALVGRVLGDETGVAVGEGLAMLNGMIGGTKDGFRLAGKAFRMNEAGGWSGKIDLPHEPAISAENWGLAKGTAFGKVVDVLGESIRLPGRALMAEDEFFKSVGYRSELHALAYRQATREASAGKIGKDEIKSRMADIIENPPDNIKISAIDHATYSTFTNTPGEFAKGWMKLCQKTPALRFITPFIKTPANIFNYAVAERSPLAPLFRSFREDIRAGGSRQQLAVARASTGTALMLTAGDLAFNGLITGGGPASASERQTLMRTGWQPYSVKMGDRYFSVSRLDPLGMSLGIAADLAEVVNHMDHDDREVDADEAAIYFAASIASNIMSKNYMRGASDFLEALNSPMGRAESFMNRFAGSFVPAAVAEVTRYQDPYMLEVNSMLEGMKARLPGLSSSLPARRDLWGRAIGYRSGLGSFYDAVSPIASRRENPEPIDREMLRNETYVAAPRRQAVIEGVTVDLTRAEFEDAYSRFVELAGNEAKHPAWNKGCMDYLNDVVTGKHPTSAVYQLRSDGPDGGKSDFIRSVVVQYRDLAKAQLLAEYPALRAYVNEKKKKTGGKWNF